MVVLFKDSSGGGLSNNIGEGHKAAFLSILSSLLESAVAFSVLKLADLSVLLQKSE